MDAAYRPGPAGRDPYTRCPDCGFIAPPESMDYAPAPDGGIDWDRPVRVTCVICHADNHIGAGDVLPLDSAMTCKRCSARVACPAWAARVLCTGCSLFLIGPDLTPAQLGEQYNQPGKRPLLLCQGCPGKHVALRALYESGPGLDQPVTVTITVAPGRRAQVFGAP